MNQRAEGGLYPLLEKTPETTTKSCYSRGEEGHLSRKERLTTIVVEYLEKMK
jgi:hypothetical protein